MKKWMVIITCLFSSLLVADISTRLHLKVNTQGDAVLVWSTTNASYSMIKASTFEAGTSWSTAETISSARLDAFYPDVSLTDTGEIITLWGTRIGTNFCIQAVTSLIGQTWSAPTNISNSSHNAFFPSIAKEQSGKVVASWQSLIGQDFYLTTATYLSGQGWQTPVTYDDTFSFSVGIPSISMNATGEALVLNKKRSDDNQNVIQSLVTFAGRPYFYSQVISSPTVHAANPQGAIIDSGSGLAVWQGAINREMFIQTSNYDPDSGWSSPVNLSSPRYTAFHPQVSMNQNGIAIAIWQRIKNASILIEASIKPAGGNWGTPVVLSLNDAISEQPQISLNDSGQAMAIWTVSDRGDSYIQACFLQDASNGNWGAPATISSTNGNSDYPQIGIDDSGNAVAAWRTILGTRSFILASMYSAQMGRWGSPQVIDN